jgi:SAM-dependent methyltransferase
VSPHEYALGSDDLEIARLQSQANIIAEPTALLLRRAGIGPGMRVLDLGSGPGDVTFQVAQLVGPDGFVVGIDRDPAQLAAAERRLAASGLRNVAFRQGDVRTFTDGEAFDAAVCRLLLIHLPDAVDVLAHHIGNLRPAGLFVAVDYDMGGMRSVPEVGLYSRIRDWLLAGFSQIDGNPYIGHLLPMALAEAGFEDVDVLGFQSYWRLDDRIGTAYVAGTVRTMKDAIVGSGVATESDLGLDTLAQRLGEDLLAAKSVWTLPTVVGAWGTRAG